MRKNWKVCGSNEEGFRKNGRICSESLDKVLFNGCRLQWKNVSIHIYVFTIGMQPTLPMKSTVHPIARGQCWRIDPWWFLCFVLWVRLTFLNFDDLFQAAYDQCQAKMSGSDINNRFSQSFTPAKMRFAAAGMSIFRGWHSFGLLFRFQQFSLRRTAWRWQGSPIFLSSCSYLFGIATQIKR